MCTTTTYLLLLYVTSLEEVLLHEMAVTTRHMNTRGHKDERTEAHTSKLFCGMGR